MTIERTAAEEAAKLVKDTAEATALSLNVQYIQRDIQEIKQSIKDIAIDKDTFVKKDEFVFWRNVLVSGLLVSVAVGLAVNILRT